VEHRRAAARPGRGAPRAARRSLVARIIAAIAFDPDDRRAASAEMLDRYARSEAARVTHPSGMEFQRALLEHDLERCRATIPDGFVFHDHRRTDGGRFESVDEFIAWLAALVELSPDAIIEPLYYVAVEKHGFLTVAHTYGTLAEGGEFESVFVQLALHRGGAPVGAEVFEIEDLDLARARFEELRPDSR
jgi:hypothetical protein